MSPEEEVVILRSILGRVAKGPMWWARLSYPDGLRGQQNWWTEQESQILHRVRGVVPG